MKYKKATGSYKIPIGLQCLLKAYPEHLKSASTNTLVWKDGTEMIFSDSIEKKDYETALNFPDLQDQMSIIYPAGKKFRIPIPKNFDPGRIRYEPFFLKMYGKSANEVKANLIPISWLPKTINKSLMITSINDVNKKLQAVSNELDKLPDSLKKYIINPAGTFNWRTISGTERFSTHCFGIAIDINVDHSNYWKWDNQDSGQTLSYRNRIPLEIVEIFERHGFIWGGKWYHYDTMHFEYRPELLMTFNNNRKN